MTKISAYTAMLSASAAISTQSVEAQTATITDVDILQFALNLEYLEAEFYTYAASGRGIVAHGIGVDGDGTEGVTTGGDRVNFNSNVLPLQRIVEELAFDERAHVTLLRGALTAAGVKPVAKPALNLGGLGFGFGGQADFFTVARILEDIGVTAYGGAAPLISNKDYLGVAARILAVEAFHSGNIRLVIAENRYNSVKVDGVDIVPPPTGTRYFATDDNALSAVRTPAQVLYLAYGMKANATSGGFYPAGFNGKLATSGTAA
ncbi:ferritin-like domain-containing protein [Bryobacter aggregatus]|uniref:ferritin-like domain-containing protein n=1 Tax=Bryobacter aggregatus TaxID=360054 RepID=UPI00138E2765|nr:ferritin-like domain-containing protein [Bryobacter aggregatus]